MLLDGAIGINLHSITAMHFDGPALASVSVLLLRHRPRFLKVGWLGHKVPKEGAVALGTYLTKGTLTTPYLERARRASG